MDDRIYQINHGYYPGIETHMKPFFFVTILTALLLIVPASAYYSDAIIPAGTGFMPVYNASYPGERNAGQWYDFAINNVSGYADVKYHFTVYDAQIKDSYQYRSDAWGEWWRETAGPGKKFLFVWICGYSEGTSWYGWGPERFFLWINGETIPQEPIMVSDIGKVRRGTAWSSQVPPRTIRFMENRTSFKDFPYSQDAYGYSDGIMKTRMEPGKSNAWSGYIIYQVPETSTHKDMQIAGWFDYFGTAYWNLQPRVYIQDSPEYLEIKQRELIENQIRKGSRLRDNATPRRSV